MTIRYCSTACAFAFALLCGMAAVAAEPFGNASKPFAYARVGTSNFILFGNPSVFDVSDAACRELSNGRLASVTTAEEWAAVQALNKAYYAVNNPFSASSGSIVSESGPCSWIGYTNMLNGKPGAFLDGSSTAFLSTLTMFNETVINEYSLCGATCSMNNTYFVADCDYFPLTFICRTLSDPPASTPVIQVPTEPAAPIIPPAYPPSYGNDTKNNNFTRPSRATPSATTCTEYKGYSYCFYDGDSYPAALSDAAYICSAAGKALLSVSSADELRYITTFVNRSAPVYWTAGVRASVNTRVHNLDASDATYVNSVLSSVAAPDAALTNMSLAWPYPFQSCVWGLGCGVAITVQGGAAGAGGLQYLDPGFGAGFICKAPVTSRPADAPVVKVTLATTLSMDSAKVTAILTDSTAKAVFVTDFKATTAPAFNTTPANVEVTSVTAATARRALLAQSGLKVDFVVTLPPSITTNEQALAAANSFRQNSDTLYRSSAMASSYGVTGASTTVVGATGGTDTPITPITPITPTVPTEGENDNKKRKLALGVGIGVGVGVPLLVALALLTVFVVKRKRNQTVSPAGSTSGAATGADAA